MQQPSGRQSSRGLRSNSGRMNASPSSGRVSASGSARGSARGSAALREQAGSPARSARKVKSGGGNELIICSVVIVALVITCAILWVHRSNEQQAYVSEKRGLNQARETNKERAFRAFMQAQSVGHEFVLGKKTDATRESLVSSLQGDPTIYNVIFTWTHKKKQQTIPVQHALYGDTEHMNIKQTGRSTVKEGISMVYGYTNSGQPIYVATKMYPPPQGEKNNLGGDIMVIVNAESEDPRSAGNK